MTCSISPEGICYRELVTGDRTAEKPNGDQGGTQRAAASENSTILG